MNNNLQSLKDLTHLNVPQYVEIKNIVIPIIQRDYAQGREVEKLRRDAFLNSIFDVLRGDKILDLDFVYGEIKGNDFIPIDGQQRLTTIYLLYFYLALREDKFDDFLKLPELTYRTRFTAKQFFDYLRKINIKELTKEKVEKNPPSRWIKEQPWFFSDYEKDHTVNAVIQMLDSLHDCYKILPDSKSYYNRLKNIKFTIYPINGGISSDELYVRMNARGKQLSNFENFKAKIYEKVNFKAKIDEEVKQDSFATKATRWQDEFWLLNNEIPQNYNDDFFKKLKTVPDDKNLYAFIRLLMVGKYIEIEKDITNERNVENLKLKCLKNLIGTDDSEIKKEEISYYLYDNYFQWSTDNDGESSVFLKECVEYISSYIELFLNKEVKDILGKRRDFDSKKLCNFKEYSLPNIVWLCAMLRYCANENNKYFNDWARVVNNLIDNQQIDGALEVYSAIKSIMGIIDSLKMKEGNVLEWLKCVSDEELKNFNGFKYGQLKEEKNKAELILKDRKFEEPIRKLEDIKMLSGNISFALELSKENGTVDLNSLETYANLCENLFKYIDDESKKGNDEREYLFERALFTFGDYTWSKHLLTKDIYDRDYSYKKLLNHEDEEKRDCILGVLRRLYDYTSTDIKYEIGEILGNIIGESQYQNEKAPWRYLFVKEPSLFAYSAKGLFCFYNDKREIYLPKATNCISDSPELYSYYFFKKHKKKFGIVLNEVTVEEHIIHFKIGDKEYKITDILNFKGEIEQNDLRQKFLEDYNDIEKAKEAGVIVEVPLTQS